VRINADEKVLTDRIKRHETPGGIPTLEPYQDSLGIWTVGYGRNCQHTSFSRAECELMFEFDFIRAKQGAENFAFYDHLNPARRGVLIEMLFQMGPRGVGRFIKFGTACMEMKWDVAAAEMLDSKWYSQTPKRALLLSEIFARGYE